MRGRQKAAKSSIGATMTGIRGPQTGLDDPANGILNQLGINCLRTFPIFGHVVWGARTLRGADQLADEYKYVPVRRTALFIEESLYRGLKWVVFEPNDPFLWGRVTRDISAFLRTVWRSGALFGTTPEQSFYVKCDAELNPPEVRDQGQLIVEIGLAPVKPAEFVIFRISQWAGGAVGGA